MKQKKTAILLLALLLVTTAAGCSAASGKPTPPSTATAAIQPANSETTPGGTTDTGTATQTFVGTVEEVKSFMVTVSDDAGEAYVFTIDNAAVKVGDTVEVTYTGDLADMDSALVATAIKTVK